jgi:shikimate kinase
MTTPALDDSTTRPSIVLIGLRGCGKSTVGRRLAELLGWEYVDTDTLIAERAGKSIASLFEEEGEAGFRRRERETIARLAADRPAVISVGGGAVVDTRNTELLRAVGKLAWLTAPAEVLWRRIQADPSTTGTRPALTRLSESHEVEHLLAKRKPFYESAADLVVDTANRDPDDIAKEIIQRLGIDKGG